MKLQYFLFLKVERATELKTITIIRDMGKKLNTSICIGQQKELAMVETHTHTYLTNREKVNYALCETKKKYCIVE